MLHNTDDLPTGRKPRRRNRKALVEYVVRDAFFEGFMHGVNSGDPVGLDREARLEYASTSGLYGYNEVRRIAHRAGYDFAIELMADKRRFGGSPYKIPASVFAECYAEMRIAEAA